MTDMQGNVTDRYDYDAWGGVDHLSGSTADNPYLYVGELGYYDHWQAPALADMLHLGVRFYEPEVGRFGQRDRVASHRQSAYHYASLLPTRRTDASGMRDEDEDEDSEYTIPILVKDASCDRIGYGKEVEAAIKWAQSYWVKNLVESLQLRLCREKIKVICHKQSCVTRAIGLGGGAFPGWGTIHIWLPYEPKDGTRVPVGCLILHEMIHSCSNLSQWGHWWMKQVSVPGCPESIL